MEMWLKRYEYTRAQVFSTHISSSLNISLLFVLNNAYRDLLFTNTEQTGIFLPFY